MLFFAGIPFGGIVSHVVLGNWLSNIGYAEYWYSSKCEQDNKGQVSNNSEQKRN